MGNFLLILFCLGSGMTVKRLNLFPSQAHQTLNAFVIYISLPAVALIYIPKLQVSVEMLFPFLVGWGVILLAIPYFRLVAKALSMSNATLGALVLTCGFGNVSFVGYPITEAFYGQSGLEVAVFLDQGCFLALAAIGLPLAMTFGEGNPNVRSVLKKVITFPPFIAFTAALLMQLFGLRFPLVLDDMLEALARTLTPLSLTSVGLQLTFDTSQIKWRDVAVGLVYKLGIAPVVIFGLAVWVLGAESLPAKVSIVEAAMPPMVTASILASQYKLNPPLASLMVGFGLLVSLPLLGAWYWFLG
jgi:predicted permease